MKVYIALDGGHVIRAAMTDHQKFDHWLRNVERVAIITVIEAMLDEPETSEYYFWEDWLCRESSI